MPEFRSGELSQWVSRMWSNGIPEGRVCGVTQDTRKLQRGDLYVAIRGEHFDGHDFVGVAFEKGASGALVEEGFSWSSNPILRVPDTIRGLQDLARGYRKKWLGVPIGITGSVGKTTVKEMCAAILSVSGETHRTAGNYNNHIGLPLSMLSMPQAARYGVFEIGMNHPGEISELAYLLQPKIAILTDICNAHRMNFDSLEDIAREKSKLAERVPSSGMVILDRDSEWYTVTRRLTCANVVSISFEGIGDYVGRRVGSGVMNVNGFDYIMPLPGEHIMRNALRAIALGLELRMAPDEIAEGLRRFRPAAMRWQESEINGVGFINDAYNANPLSMKAALQTYATLQVPGKRWAVVGGMRELGDTSEEEHAALGRLIDELQFDGLITVGQLGRLIVSGGCEQTFHCNDAAEAAQILKDHLSAGDRVLLKASRGERLEQVLTFFREN
ncbi:MAG: UDP-N-acetylmuramoyl-tripeptide--D-alanyl-D-alanine ligase [Pontiellaceae bacterium]|nr:UDP-N-acetylmuramoyl-tripeptide--D-alanyl-D-alanine ligase [Pontiellaceae bacterium]MBN2785208.1 UDP-N-acetylmuramoyl-tripeptide--D-alanyl-D-alanine ligase [Pontiellaceae bacterium]